MSEIELWFNPRCSKCRGARDLLAEQGVETREVRYLDDAPTAEQLRDVLRKLGTDDPRAIARRGEPVWAELGLDDADDEAVLAALAANPILVERPIAIRGERAVIGRPPERVLDLLDG